MDKIPFIAYESGMARLERTIKRLWILAIILVILLVGSNVAWIYYESSMEEITEITQDAEWDSDSNVIINGTGEVAVNE